MSERERLETELCMLAVDTNMDTGILLKHIESAIERAGLRITPQAGEAVCWISQRELDAKDIDGNPHKVIFASRVPLPSDYFPLYRMKEWEKP